MDYQATEPLSTIQSLQHLDRYDFPICTAMDLFDIVHELNRLEKAGPTFTTDRTRSLQLNWPPTTSTCDAADQTMTLRQAGLVDNRGRRDLNRTFSELFPELYR